MSFLQYLAACALSMAAKLLPRGGKTVVMAEFRLFSEGSEVPCPRATESRPRLNPAVVVVLLFWDS